MTVEAGEFSLACANLSGSRFPVLSFEAMDAGEFADVSRHDRQATLLGNGGYLVVVRSDGAPDFL